MGTDTDEFAAMAKRMRRDSEHWFPKWHDGTLPLPIAYALGLAGEVGEVANDEHSMLADACPRFTQRLNRNIEAHAFFVSLRIDFIFVILHGTRTCIKQKVACRNQSIHHT